MPWDTMEDGAGFQFFLRNQFIAEQFPGIPTRYVPPQWQRFSAAIPFGQYERLNYPYEHGQEQDLCYRWECGLPGDPW